MSDEDLGIEGKSNSRAWAYFDEELLLVLANEMMICGHLVRYNWYSAAAEATVKVAGSRSTSERIVEEPLTA